MNTKATFRPHERLKDPRDFRRAFERRRSESDMVLVVYGVENGLAHARLGISVAKKKFRSASSRNRLKRLVREAFRLNKANLPGGVDLVVIPRTQNPNAEAIRHSLIQLASRIARRLGSRQR
jgi:ribonuclease P protein component